MLQVRRVCYQYCGQPNIHISSFPAHTYNTLRIDTKLSALISFEATSPLTDFIVNVT